MDFCRPRIPDLLLISERFLSIFNLTARYLHDNQVAQFVDQAISTHS